MSQNLGAKVVQSGLWVLATRILQRALSFIRSIILARLLSPEDFGLFGVALLTLATLDTFAQTGFRQALIQKSESTTMYLDTAWSVELIKGSILAALLYILAPYAAAFFQAPETAAILRVIAASVMVQHITNIAIVVFEKELEFHKFFLFNLTGTVGELIISTTAALFFRSVWALVAGRLAGDLIRCGVSFFLAPCTPRFRLSLARFWELFSFGKWVLGSGILTFLLTQGDDILVGRLLGVTALGLYQMAYLLSNLPATEVSHLISQITFPAYAKIQNNAARLRDIFLMTVRSSALISFFMSGIVFVLVDDFIQVFMKEQWLPIVPAVKVLCFFGMTRSLNAVMGSLFMATGNPHVITLVGSLQLVLLAIIIVPLTIFFGITGTACAVVIPNTAALLYLMVRLPHSVNITPLRYIRNLLPPLCGCTMILLMLSYLKTGSTVGSGYGMFFINVCIGIALYFSTTFLVDRVCGGELLQTLKHIQGLVRTDGA